MPGALERPLRRPIVPFTHRIFSALFLRSELYAYAATDPSALSQAMAVVCFAGMVQPSVLTRELGAWGMLISLLFAVARWLVFATVIVYPVARLAAAKPIGYRPLLSCLGYAEAPSFLNLLAFMTADPLPPWARAGIWLWLLAANVVAVRAAASVGTTRAAVIGVVSFLIYLAVGLASDIAIHLPP
jgi:hypothetical protein